ncbi:MAG TPA: hypothetical protein VGW10_03620 [Solirubrobacteraceae bacterium]|nr:hypothetical protein [Solirubrobacteraceae bacterium]
MRSRVRRAMALVRAERGRRRAAWLAGCIALTSATLALTVPREASFEAQTLMVATPVRPFPPRPDAHFLNQLGADPRIGTRIAAAAGVRGRLNAVDVTLTDDPAGRGSIVQVRAHSPALAERILDLAAEELREASRRHLASASAIAANRLARVRVRTLNRRELREHRLLVARVNQLVQSPLPQVAPRGRRSVERIDRPLDEFMNSLPGPYPARPDPTTLAVATPAILLCAWLAALALLPPRRDENA